jgi:hypothetical protein
LPILRPVHTPEELRSIQREVALAYRRAGRAAKLEGLAPPEMEATALDAAHATYRRLVPDAPPTRLEVSEIVNVMIANAIRVNTDWFWHGPDA